MKLLLLIWCSTVAFYLLFLIFAAYHQAKIAGRQIPVTSLVLIGPAVLAGFVLDIVWNATIGSVIFWEPPRTLTFTARLKAHKLEEGWRGKEARWFATLINWADPGHV